jgi:cell division protein FtsI/penicillin-binding protein 2
VEEVLVHSSNIGTYKIAKKAGVGAFFDYARRMGFGVRPGTGLAGESPGRLSDERVTNSRFSRLAMGYSVAATPLQIAMTTAAVANGGLLMKPRLVDRIARADGSELEVIAPVVAGQAMKPRTADILREMLVKVVSEGTGKQAALEHATVAGKTGTAQRYDEEKGDYVEGEYNTLFAGFAPAEAPKVACVVVLEAPKAEKSQLYGGKVSAPIFQEVVREALDHLEVGKRQFRVKLAQKGGAP